MSQGQQKRRSIREGTSRKSAELQRSAAFIYGAVGLTVLLYALPVNLYLDRPLLWLSTLAHELGHGLTALSVGGYFDLISIDPDGSGFASAGTVEPLTDAWVCAGGLLGPAFAAALGFVAARRARTAQISLVITALCLGLPLSLAADHFTAAFIAGVALTLLVLALRRNPRPAQIALVFLSTQLALSVFSSADYLFVKGAGFMPSDVSQMASALGGPYWLWGALCGAVSIIILLVGLWLFTLDLPSFRLRAKKPR